MSSKILNALPNYFGGKRKLVKKILSFSQGETFIDAFMGAGSVSLFAKAKNYRVIANDYSERCYVIGKALIENSTVLIEEADLDFLLLPGKEPGFMEKNYSDEVLLKEHRQILDSCFTRMQDFSETKKCLLFTALIKFIQRMRPFGQFNRKLPLELIKSKNYQKIFEDKVFGAHLHSLFTPLAVLKRQVQAVNAGVFDNGKNNEFYKKDVFDFLKLVQGDTVYLDPPYFGSSAYETEYNFIDCFLAQKKLPVTESVFNRTKAIQFLDLLFEACEKFPTCIVSYGEQEVLGEKILLLMQKYWKHVELHKLDYRYAISAQAGDKAKHAKEILLVARQ